MIEGHDRAVLEFSGGKDSLACLYLARPYLDRITVIFADTGGVYPHLVKFIHETCERLGAKLQVVRPFMPVTEYTEAYGLPSDIVPEWATYGMARFLKKKPEQLLQGGMACCVAMLLAPMHQAVIDSGCKLVIRGAKKADSRVGVPPGHVDEHGIEYRSPVWDWSDDDVYAYLEREGAPLAPHYAEVKDSLDCWMCTAHMPYGDAAKKIEYTRKHYPELWPVVADRLARVRRAVAQESVRVDSVLAEYGQ